MRNGPSEMVNLANSLRSRPSDLMNSLLDDKKPEKKEEKEEKANSVYNDEL